MSRQRANPKRSPIRRLLGLAVCAAVLLPLGRAAAGKPRPPVAVQPRIVETDPVAGTVDLEITARSLIEGAAIAVSLDLPEGTAVIPGVGGWRHEAQAGHVLRVRLRLAPGPTTLAIRTRLHAPNVDIGAVASIRLPGAETQEEMRDEPRILETDAGERLRLHTDDE